MKKGKNIFYKVYDIKEQQNNRTEKIEKKYYVVLVNIVMLNNLELYFLIIFLGILIKIEILEK
jgi:hypothetical protein